MTRQFPDILSAYLDYTSGHESTIRVRKWCLLSIVAAALERRVWLPRGYYKLTPNLYTFIIGKSGLVKKSTTTAIAVDLLRKVPKIKIMSERLTASALIHLLSKAGGHFQFEGKKVPQSPVFAYASELSVFLEEVFGNITDLLTTFYDGGPKDGQPWIYKTMAHDEIKIYAPCLNILGASTKAWLRKCIPKSEMEGGFTSRIIFVVEENLPDKLVAWPEINTEKEELGAKIVKDLTAISQLVGSFKVKPDAKESFTAWYEDHMRRVLPKNRDPRMIGYLSRKGDTILKVAMIRSVCISDSLILKKDDIEWAGKEIDALEKDWLLAFDNVGIVGSVAFQVMSYVRGKGMVSKKEFWKVMNTTLPQDKVNVALSELFETEEIIETIVSKHGENVEHYALPGLVNTFI